MALYLEMTGYLDDKFVKWIPIANTLTTAVVWIRNPHDTLWQADAGNLIAKQTQN